MSPAQHGRLLRGALAALAALAAAGATALPISAQEAVAILEAASARYRALDGFCADFEQELYVALLRQTTTSRGELCQRPPGRFEMRFTEPEGDRIVADGSHIWIYFPSTDPGQAFQIRAEGAEGRFDFHAEFLSEPGLRYRSTLEGTDEVAGRRAHRILLEPREPSPYERVRVWIDAADRLVRRMEIHEEEGTVRRLDFRNLRLDPPLSAERFTFHPPEGVRVIVREGMR